MDNNNSSSSPYYSIKDLYKDSCVFVTGATGFLGRLLVEKLLRSCEPKRIYVLVRPKKGKEMQQRLRELFDGIVFDKIRKLKPDFSENVIGIYGDSSEINLGITEEDLETLRNNVNFIFHCAATVNFEEKLKMATLINIRGTREVIRLARSSKNLKFLVHVSTAYAHCHRALLEEKFYDSHLTPEQLITIVENLPDETINRMESLIVEQFPNTYAFTKSISEQLLQNCNDLPVAVYRPAIIVSTYKEPIPGWINNYYGPQGVTAGAMVGLLRSLHCDETAYANIVPVDMCVNTLLAIPWDSIAKFDKAFLDKEKYEIPICNYESNTYNPISWKQFRYWTKELGSHCKTVKMVGIYFFHLRKNYAHHLLAVTFLHYIPAILVDLLLICTGKKPKMLEGYKKIHKFSNVISYFCSRHWHFKSERLAQMCDSMSEEDSEDFFCDLRRLEWLEFFRTYLFGCRVYLIKDPPETIEKAQRMYKKFEVFTIFVVTVFFLFVGFLLHRLVTLMF